MSVPCIDQFKGTFWIKLTNLSKEISLDLEMPEMYLGSKSKEFFLKLKSNLNTDGFFTAENGLKITKHVWQSKELGQNLRPITN